MKAIVSFDEDGQQTLCMVRNGELIIDVTDLDGDTIEFVKMDADTTRELLSLLRREVAEMVGEHGVALRPVPEKV